MALYGETDLVMTRDEPYARTLNYSIEDVLIDWTGWTLRLELRDQQGVLLGDLTPYLAVGVSPTDLEILVPGTVTALLPAESRWDILGFAPNDEVNALRFPKPAGRVLVRGGVTRRG